jgi:hypothetical protein
MKMKKSTQIAFRRLLMFIGLLWFMAVSSYAQVPTYVHSGRTTHLPPTRNGLVIYDQLNEISNNGIASQEFGDIPTYTSYAADDFIVPTGSTWNIHYIDVAGFFMDNAGVPLSAVNVFIYADDNGKPGNVINTFTNVTSINQIAIDTLIHKLEIALPSALVMAEGHYWLSVQAVGDYNSIGYWRWCSHVGQTINNEFYFKNPLDGFGTGMIDWTSSLLIAWSDFNLAFAFYGQGLANDLSMLSIDTPVTGPGLSANEPITVVLKNEGTNTQSGFNVSFSLDGSALVSENVGALTLIANQIVSYTFTATANLSVPGPHLIAASVNLAADTRPENNSANKLVYNLGTIFPMPATGNSTITTCGATFTDSGGLNGDFGMDDSATTTIYPATAGDRIKLNFLTFDASYGGFSIYDGVDMNAPLIGTWNSTNSPGEIVALNATGALTIHFEGPDWETRPGWSAYISCYTPVADDFTLLALKCNIPILFTGDNATLSAKVQNYGSLAQSKTVTFRANNNVIGTQTTPVLNPADTAWVTMPFIPVDPGNYILAASLPADQGTQPNDTISIQRYVYPFGTFYEEFEGAVFPPENWRQGGHWTRQGSYPAVGSYNADCFVDYTASDTLVSPRLEIHPGDVLSFAAKTTPWWVGNLDLYWLNEQTGVWNFMQNIPLTNFGYTWHTIDMTVAAGTNRIGFFVNVTDPNSFTGNVMVDNVIGQGITVHYDNKNLKAKAFTGNSFYNVNETANFQFVVRNDGLLDVTSGSYSVKLMKNGTTPFELLSVPGLTIASQQEITFNLPFTFLTIDTLSVYAEIEYTEDQYPEDNRSKMINLTGLANGSEIIPVGSDLYQVPWPIDFSYKKSLSETIYLNSEINHNGIIFGINYDYYFQIPENNVPVRIWVGETTVNEIVDWIPATQMTLVYDGLLNYQSGSHSIYIPFQTPFNHPDVSKNIVIMTEKIADHYNSNQNFFSYSSLTNTSIEMSGDDTIPDPNAPSGGYPTNINPNIKFIFNSNVGSLQGTVTDESLTGLIDVNVKVNELGIMANTDAAGHYLMPYIPAGYFQVTANKFEYLPMTKPATIVTGNATTLDFTLGLLQLLPVTGRVVGNNDPSIGIAGATVTLTGYSNYSSITDGQGYFVIQNVYSNNTYALEIVSTGYDTYMAQVVVDVSAVDLGVIALTETLTIPYALSAEDLTDKVHITWLAPDAIARQVLAYDDGLQENGYAGEPNEEVWLGNYFPIPEKATVTSFDLYWAGYGVNTQQTMRLDIFDEYSNLIASSNEFTSGLDEWLNIDIPNLTLQGNYYVMIHWSGNFAQSTYLAIDTTSPNLNYAYYLYPGGSPQVLSDLVGEQGTFLIHANAMVASKKKVLIPGSVNAANGYNIYMGLLSDISNAGNWPQLNSATIASTGYEDLNWPPAVNGNYVYAVKALYSFGESELAFSNVLLSLYSGTEHPANHQYSVYPNPASEFVNIVNCKGTQITLINMEGKLIMNGEIHDDNYRLDTRGFSRGVYSLRIQGNSEIVTLKIVIN